MRGIKREGIEGVRTRTERAHSEILSELLNESRGWPHCHAREAADVLPTDRGDDRSAASGAMDYTAVENPDESHLQGVHRGTLRALSQSGRTTLDDRR